MSRPDPSQQAVIARQTASALGRGQVPLKRAEVTYARNLEPRAPILRARLEDSRFALGGATKDVARLTTLSDQTTLQLGHFTPCALIAATITVRSVDPGQLVHPTPILLTLTNMTEFLVKTGADPG